jgi:hypothetical protein
MSRRALLDVALSPLVFFPLLLRIRAIFTTLKSPGPHVPLRIAR